MVMNLNLIPSKLVGIPKNVDLWRNFYFIEFTLLHGWSQVNLLRFCRTPFLNKIYGGLLLDICIITRNKENNVISNAFVLLATRFAYYSIRIIKQFYYFSCTSTVFEQEYINKIGKVEKASHSYLILACHAKLKDFPWSYGEFLNYCLPKFWSPWGKLRDRERGYDL